MNSDFKARGSRGEIWLYDPVGKSSPFGDDMMSSKAFKQELQAMGKVDLINLRINSPGGSVFEGNAIYNALKEHPATIVVDVDGMAASIASVIAMAGDSIRIAKNAMMMIHNPQGVAIGGADEMLRTAALLNTVRDGLISTYADRTNNKREQIGAWMDEEFWLTAEAAVQYGFADAVTADSKVTACFDVSTFRNVPKPLIERMKALAYSPVLDKYRTRLAEQDKRAALCRP